MMVFRVLICILAPSMDEERRERSKGIPDVRSTWGRHEERLYIRPITSVLFGPLNDKGGYADALDEDSYDEQCAL